MPQNRYRGPPMTLANMRALGVRSLSVSCWSCHHDAVLGVDAWPDNVPVPSFGPRMLDFPFSVELQFVASAISRGADCWEGLHWVGSRLPQE
jgi:hypothetical protein